MSAGNGLESTRLRAAVGALWLAAEDLRFRSLRFVVAVAAASVTLMLLLLVTGIVNQLNREPDLTTKSLSADYWIVRAGVASPFTASAAAFGSELADEVVVDGPINPVFTGTIAYTVPGSSPKDAVLVAHAEAGPGVPRPVEGELGTQLDGVAVSTEVDADVGEAISLAGFEVTVTARVENASLFSGMPLVFVPNDVLAAVAGDRPLISALLTDTMPTAVPDELVVRTRSEVASAAGAPVEKPILAMQIVQTLLGLVAAMIIGAVVYLASIERTRDVAVLRAVGNEGSMLAIGVASQALAVAIVAAVVANVLAVVVAPVFPMTVHLTPVDLVTLPLIAVVVAMASSYVSIRRTLRIDPSLAFSGAAS